MEDKKRVAILVTIALILAITAVALNVNDSKQIPTPDQRIQPTPTGAVIGIDIQEPQVEDKLTEETQQ